MSLPLKFKEAIKNLDHVYLSKVSSGWEDMSSFELLMTMCCQPKNLTWFEALGLLDSIKPLARDHRIYNILKAFLKRDFSREYVEHLFLAMIEDQGLIKCPATRAQVLNVIGYLLMTEKNYNLAYEHYKLALKSFKEAGLEVHAWRAESNILIYEFIIKPAESGNSEIDELLWKKIFNQFNKFDPQSKLTLGKRFAWVLSHFGLPKEALTVIEESCDYADSRSDLGDERALLELYRLYMESCMRESVSDLKFNSSYDDRGAIEFVLTSHLKTRTQILNFLSEIENEVFGRRYCYVDLLLRTLYHHGRDRLVLDIFPICEGMVVKDWALLVPPRSVYQSPYLAASRLRMNKKAKKFESSILEFSRPWEITSIKAKVSSLLRDLEQNRISIDINSESLTFNDRKYCFKRKRVSFKYFKVLSEMKACGEKSISLRELYRRLYSDQDSSDYRSRILSVISRSTSYIGCRDLVKLQGENVNLSDKYDLISQGFVTHRIKNRKKAIVAFLKVTKGPVSSRQLATHVGVSKKTITNDLTELVQQGAIRVLGNRRSTQYSLGK